MRTLTEVEAEGRLCWPASLVKPDIAGLPALASGSDSSVGGVGNNYHLVNRWRRALTSV